MRGIGWIALWLAMIIVGVLAFALPLAAGFISALVIAWLLVIGGVFHISAGFHVHRARSRAVHVALGLLYVAAGLYLVYVPGMALVSLTLVLAVVFFTSGVLRLLAWHRHRPAQGARWLLIDGVVSIVLGLMIGLGWPASSAWALGTLLGAVLIVNGISGLMFTLALRRSAQRLM